MPAKPEQAPRADGRTGGDGVLRRSSRVGSRYCSRAVTDDEGEDDRELLGRCRPFDPARAAADRRAGGDSARRIGNSAESPRLSGSHDVGGRHAVAAWRTRRHAGGDEAARHQRRRLLQRQLGAPIRQSERRHHSRADLPLSRDSPRPAVHVRRTGQESASG